MSITLLLSILIPAIILEALNFGLVIFGMGSHISGDRGGGALAFLIGLVLHIILGLTITISGILLIITVAAKAFGH